MQDQMTRSLSLTTPYSPVAIYYEDADIVEYVRRDVPSVSRRVDNFLTLVFDMRSREELVGFKLKGFKNFYLRDGDQHIDHFVTLVSVLERAFTDAGSVVFERREAYRRAKDIAVKDNVGLDNPLSLKVG